MNGLFSTTSFGRWAARPCWPGLAVFVFHFQPESVSAQIEARAKRQEVVSQMRLHLASAVDAEKSAVLATDDQTSRTFAEIVPDSPAAKAGLKENDVVTEINGQRVEGSEQFRRMILEIPRGRTAQLSVWRDGRQQNVAVTLGKPELGMPARWSRRDREPLRSICPICRICPCLTACAILHISIPGRRRLGIDAEDLDGDFGNYFGAPDGEGSWCATCLKILPRPKPG